MDQDGMWSVTDRDLHEQMRTHRETNTSAAVATIVGVEGSAYRRPGAKLLAPDDNVLGAITAGCLEGPVAQLAADARNSGTVAVETFDLMDDDVWGLGVGCNGIIDVLVEPLDNSFDPLLSALADSEPATVLTVIASEDATVPVGTRTVLTKGDTHSGTDRTRIPDDVLDELRPLTDVDKSQQVNVERAAGNLNVFVDRIKPASELILFGAQNDVHAVARFGRETGFRVTVATARGARAVSDTFPHAHRVVSTRPTEIIEAIDAPERTAVVLMSHNFVDDRLALESLLSETTIPYVGLMGPRKRFEEMQEEFAKENTHLTDGQLARISTPVGLDLGDGSPTGIAMSIVAEALAVMNKRDGGRLRKKKGPIHERVDRTS